MPNSNIICPICDYQYTELLPKIDDNSKINCKRCGTYTITGSLEASIKNELNKYPNLAAKISHILRKSYMNNKIYNLNSYDIKNISNSDLPTITEQADNLIRYIAQVNNVPGEYKKIDFEIDWPVIGSMSQKASIYICNNLIKEKIFETDQEISETHSYKNIRLSFKGWEKYNSLRFNTKKYRKAFIAMSFSNDDLNIFYSNFLKNGVKKTGFNLIKLDENHEAGLIDDKLRVEIQNSDFLLADLTDDNNGAYWEAGYAEGLGKPVIYLCEKKKFLEKNTHFDTSHLHTILWDLEDPEDSISKIQSSIRATLPNLAIME